MAKRKKLKGIASNIASSFISRNNDAEGYWSIGVFYKLAINNQLDTFRLNLLTGESFPFFKLSNEIANKYYNSLIKQISRIGLNSVVITDAVIEIQFKADTTKVQRDTKHTWGEPFSCKIILVDDQNKKIFSESRGWCGQHDPCKEQRRTGF